MFKHVFQSPFFWVFLFFYVANEITHFVLEMINLRFVARQTSVPEAFHGHITQETFEKAQAYTIEKTKFALVTRLIGIPFFWMLIFMGGLQVMDGFAAEWVGAGTLTQSVLFCLLVGAYFFFIGIPLKIYSTFVIEENHGFNQITPALFARDLVKSILLSLVLGTPVLYAVFWFMDHAGENWWLWVWLVLALFQLFVITVYPTWLAPLFNKFKEVEDTVLKEKIWDLVNKIKFKISGIFVMDGSKRSSHSNAYFAGMGSFRRIVLFDTIMKQLTHEELTSVLAHEVGHNVKHHIRQMVLFTLMLSLAGFYGMSCLIGWEPFYHAFNVVLPSAHTALIIFAVSFEVFTFVFTPLINMLSRRNEYEADAFSVIVTEDKASMKSSLIKISRENLSNLKPHPAYSFFHYSHPTLTERIRAIDAL